MTNGNALAVGTGALKAILVTQAVIDLIYGLMHLLMPEMVMELAQEPANSNPAWIRWSGGTLLGLAVAMYMASRDVTKQLPIVTLGAVGNTLVGAALVYTFFTEYQGATAFIAPSIVITLILAVLFWWARAKYRDIL